MSKKKKNEIRSGLLGHMVKNPSIGIDDVFKQPYHSITHTTHACSLLFLSNTDMACVVFLFFVTSVEFQFLLGTLVKCINYMPTKRSGHCIYLFAKCSNEEVVD